MVGAQCSLVCSVMRALVVALSLTCQDSVTERYAQCMEWCTGYVASSEYRACVRRCRDQRKEDTESCLLE